MTLDPGKAVERSVDSIARIYAIVKASPYRINQDTDLRRIATATPT